MTAPPTSKRRATERDMRHFADPEIWPLWPFLPVVRRRNGEDQQLGVMYDAKGTSGLFGYSATVWLANLFLLPKTEEEFLQLPRCVYDSAEELADDGWTLD